MSRKGSSKDALCCCEYENTEGEVSHLLACCCDCEAVDESCDRLLRCKRVPGTMMDKLCNTIADRCRIPGFGGKGAVRVKLDIAVPVVIILTGVLLGTINAYFTVFSLVAMPTGIMIFYRIWKTQLKKTQSKVFYSWGLTSVLLMYFIFETVVFAFREVMLYENLILSTLFGAMMYAFYHAKKNPGYIERKQGTETYQRYARTSGNYDSHGEGLHSNRDDSYDNTDNVVNITDTFINQEGTVPNVLIKQFGFDKNVVEDTMITNLMAKDERKEVPIVNEEDVVWVDSRPVRGGHLDVWCEICKHIKPQRSGHCSVCNKCVNARDHHCVWIDTCVGADNHRSFFIALVLFVICGFYGSHLTLTTVCTPEMYFDYFLLPNDCRFTYSDFPTALSWVSVCYTLIATCVMSVALIQQCILISQNITSHELHNASKRGWVSFLCCAGSNMNDHGFFRNWYDFLHGYRKKQLQYKGIPV